MAAAQAAGVPILEFTFTAGSNMSSTAAGNGPNGSYQYTAVKFSADRAVAPSSSAGTRVVGILQTQPLANEAAVVRILGISKCVVDGTTPIAAGDMLTTDSVGRGVKTTTTGAESFAQACEGSTAQNDIISVIVLPAA